MIGVNPPRGWPDFEGGYYCKNRQAALTLIAADLRRFWFFFHSMSSVGRWVTKEIGNIPGVKVELAVAELAVAIYFSLLTENALQLFSAQRDQCGFHALLAAATDEF